MNIGFIGFGEAGQAFAASLAGLTDITAYDIKGAALADKAAELGVTYGGPEVLSRADIVFSAVTAAVSHDAVVAVAGHLRDGQVVVDLNSVSPARKLETARIVRGIGAAYVDMAVMAPVTPAGHRTPVLVAGDHAAVTPWLRQMGFRFDVAGDEVGQAAGVKMVRSLFVKGLEAITVASLSAAEKAGCNAVVMASLAKSFPGLGWPDFAEYAFERVQQHGRRRAAEMRECALAMAELDLPEAVSLATAIAEVQQGFAKR